MTGWMPAVGRGRLVFAAAGSLVFVAGVALLVGGRGAATAGPGEPPRLTVSGAYTPTAGRSANTAAYFTIHNAGGADRLVGVRTDVAAEAMLGRGGLSEMRMVNAVAVPAHGSVPFTPGGLAPMFMQTRHALRAGDRVRLTLLFARSSPVTVDVPVMALPGVGHD